MWDLLRAIDAPGVNFRRQGKVGRYVVDFVARKAKLVIEVDGGIHRLKADADLKRQQIIEAAGYRVLRVSNENVINHPSDVMLSVRLALDEGEDFTPTPTPSPQGGGVPEIYSAVMQLSETKGIVQSRAGTRSAAYARTTHDAVAQSIRHVRGPVAIAVSGGSDSIALLMLAAEAARDQGKSIIAATVDHGLRAAAADEARWVQTQCAAIAADLNNRSDAQAGAQAQDAGFTIKHTILHWRGEKPTTGIPAAARQARYALLSEWARSHGADRILLGHTLDDQAETVAYRIASNGGMRGAAGLRALSVCPVWPEGRGILLSRPLLQTRRADLQNYLRAENQTWIDDPSNEDLHYGRPRMRAKLQALSETQPSLISRLAAIGDRLGAAQAAIESEALDLLEAHLTFDPFGAGLLDPAPLRGAPREVRAAALSFAIQAVSGEAHAPALAALPDLWARLEAKACAVTLGGARVGRLGARHGHRLLLTRDPGGAIGRDAPRPDILLRPGETSIFDGRFELSTTLSGAAPNRAAQPAPALVRALGSAAAKGVNLPERLKAALKDAPAPARASLPGIYFANDSNSATAPDFSTPATANMAEASDESRILARFLGKVRLEAQRAAVKALLIGPV